MTQVSEVANAYSAQRSATDPAYATLSGLGSSDQNRRLPNYSPDGIEEQLDLNRNFIATMATATPTHERDHIAKRVFNERLAVSVHEAESGDAYRRLSIMLSPMQEIREAFDLLPRDSTEQWKVVTARMTQVPAALQSLTASLKEGQQRGVSASRRQAVACAQQATTWAGHEGTSRYFGSLVTEFKQRGTADRKVEEALAKPADAADAAYGEFGSYLSEDYAPAAPSADGVGRDRYRHTSQEWLGLDLDIDGAYAWGWDELHRVQDEIKELCQRIAPGLSYREVVALLNADHERVMHGEAQQRDWLQSLMTRTIERLSGAHFDIPAELHRIEVRIAPMGTAAAQYYLAPSDDFSRPGTYWFPTSGRTRFPIWNEVSTAYHEGVPGHHLLIGYQTTLRDSLTDFQRHLRIGGHAEGWAMYAERLMGELGFFDRPEYELDMLSNSLLRAARIVVDIGLHVGLPIPGYGNKTWTAQLAREFLLEHCSENEAFVASEIDRYLGLPGQALTYKLGEAVWLEARSAARKRDGAGFDLRSFHTEALNIGPVGLAHLRDVLITNKSTAQ